MTKKKNFTGKQKDLMQDTVVHLIDSTFLWLDIFMKEDEQCPPTVFIENITKNFVGNIIYQMLPSKDPAHYRVVADSYIEHLQDFFDKTISDMKAAHKQQSEIH